MANFETIKTTIDANINTNGNQAITGAVMNSVLKQMVDSTDTELAKLSDVIVGGETKYTEQVSAGTRMTKYIQASGKVAIKVELTEGTTDTLWNLYFAATSSSLGQVVKTNNALGEVIVCDIPKDNYGLFVLTQNQTATGAEVGDKYTITITKDGSIVKKIETIENEVSEISSEMSGIKEDVKSMTEIAEMRPVTDNLFDNAFDAEGFFNADGSINPSGFAVYTTQFYAFPKGVNRKVFLKRNDGVEPLSIAVYDSEKNPVLNNESKTSCIVGNGATLRDEVAYFRVYTRNVDTTSMRCYVGLTEFDGSYDFEEKRIVKLENLPSLPENWGGKSILCIGDSITEFDNKGMRYSDFLSLNLNCPVTNVGIGGTRLSIRKELVNNPSTQTDCFAHLDIANIVRCWVSGDWEQIDIATAWLDANVANKYSDIISRYKNTDISKCDVITIFAGTNDYMQGAEMGDDGSTSRNDVNGAIYNIVNDLLSANPKLRIAFFTPIVNYADNVRDDAHWCDNYTPTTGGMTGIKKGQYCDMLEASIKRNHIPCNNWYHTLGWNRANFATFFPTTTDSTHPFGGFEWLGRVMAMYLKQIW
jgi:hypothetical protein